MRKQAINPKLGRRGTQVYIEGARGSLTSWLFRGHKAKMTTHYINTDLDLVSRADLSELARLFESRGLFLIECRLWTDGYWRANFETEEQFIDAESTVVALLDVLDGLVVEVQGEWNSCSARVFNVGYQSGNEPLCIESEVSNEALRRIVDFGASLKVTVYGPPPNSQAESKG